MSTRRVHDRDFRLKAIARLEAGESGTSLARELGVQRSMLYRWWDCYRRGGPVALRERGLPRQDFGRSVEMEGHVHHRRPIELERSESSDAADRALRRFLDPLSRPLNLTISARQRSGASLRAGSAGSTGP